MNQSVSPPLLFKAPDTIKLWKIGTPKVITVIVQKMEQFGFTVQIDEMENSVGPDQG